MTVHPSQVLRYLSSSKVAELGSDRVEVRLMSLTISVMFFYQLAEPGSYILVIKDSMVWRVASTMQWGSEAIGALYYLNAAMLLPLMFVLLFRPSMLQCKMPRQLAALAGILGAILWGLMATRSLEIDVRWLTTVWALRAFVDLGLGLLFGVSLNAQHAREAADRIARQREQHAPSDFG